MLRSIKVWIFTPPLGQSGGIGSLYSYANSHYPENIEVKIVDTRGAYKHPIFSVIPLTGSITRLIFARLFKRVDLVHINIASNGSALRKIIIGLVSIFLTRTPTIFQVHGGKFVSFYSAQSEISKYIILKVLNSSERILLFGSISSASMKLIGIKSELITEMQMGVPNLLSKDSDELKSDTPNLANTYPIILYSGLLTELKGFPETIKALAFEAESKTKLIVAGSGDLRQWMGFAANLGLENRVAFVGQRSIEEIHSYLQVVDGLILASKFETLPVSVLECLSAGKVPIATMVGNLSEFLNSENAIIVKSPTESDIACAVMYLEKIYETPTFSNLKIQAKNLWSQKFDVSKTTLNLVSIWRENLFEE